MNPLTVTWPPILYTDYGYRNFNQWLNTGNFENISAKRNKDLMIFLTKKAIINLLHPFQTFILGQKNFAAKVAIKYKIPLIFYGENEAEHGNPIGDNFSSIRDRSYYTFKNIDKIFLGGLKINEIIKKGFKFKDIEYFLPSSEADLKKIPLEVHYLGYYLKWVPQETYYYSVKNSGFRPRPFRTQGTYSKYNSIDDKIDDLHYYTTYIKFGIGRATYDASQEIRNDHLSSEEGRRLIKKYDGEFPDRYFDEIMNYLRIKKPFFIKHCDKFRSPHLWVKKNKKWALRHTVNLDGTDD